jgi:hypothetical protein
MDTNIVLDLAGNKIKCEKEVKLLGVTVDFELKFNSHISNICKKASRQLNVLKRLGKYLNKLGNSFHSLAAAYRKDFRPYLVVRTEGISVMLSYLKQYLVSLILIKSCKYEGLS